MLTFGHRFAACFTVVMLAGFLFAYSAMLARARLPDDASGMMVVLFSPGTDDRTALTAIVEAGGKPVGQFAGRGEVWTVFGADEGFLGRAKAGGAWIAFRELPVVPLVAGCLTTISPSKLRLQDAALR